MRRLAFILVLHLCVAGRLRAQQATSFALVFSYRDREGVAAPSRLVAGCLQRLVAQGTTGHSGGYRPGVHVEQRGDTLEVKILSYAVAPFNPKDWQSGDWHLVVGNLAPGRYVIVWRTRPDDPTVERLTVPGDEDGPSPLCRHE